MTAPLTTLGKHAEIQSGLTTRSVRIGEGVPVLTMASLPGVHASGCRAGSLLMAEPDGGMKEARYQVGPLDLLIPARTTPNHLNPVLLSENFPDPLVFNSTLLRIRTDTDVLHPWWLLGYLRSPQGRKQLLQGSQSTTGQLNLNAKTLAGFELPALTMAEQSRLGELIRLAHTAHRRALAAADLRLRIAQAVAFPCAS